MCGKLKSPSTTAVGLEPLMLSMPHIVRPRSLRHFRKEGGFPARPATRRFIKRNKELAETSYQEFLASSKPGCRIYLIHGRIRWLVISFSETKLPACRKPNRLVSASQCGRGRVTSRPR